MFLCISYVNGQLITVASYGVDNSVWNSTGKFVQIKRTGTTTFQTGMFFFQPVNFTRPIKIEAVVYLESSLGITDISDTLKFTSSDIISGDATNTKFINCSIQSNQLADNGTDRLKLKYRYYKDQYPFPDYNDGWTEMYGAPGSNNYSILHVRFEPGPLPTINGPTSICSEEIYTVANATTVTLEGANNTATLTDLGGGQYKVSKIGNGSGKIVLVADNGQNNVSQTIYVGNPSSGDIKDSANGITLQPSTIYQFYVDSGFNLNSFNWSVIGGTIISGQNSNVITVRTDQNPHTADNNLSITLNYVGECGSKIINANRWVAPGGGDIPNPGEIL
ncbi:hypothetical protein E2P86_08730 [Sphingobacterium psychroaquaticum]|nr:hypothetical protein E2P86_08730 [Sphingobacterium psychroaquaticum]